MSDKPKPPTMLPAVPERAPARHFALLDADGWPLGFYRSDMHKAIPAGAVELPEDTVKALRAPGKRYNGGQVRAVTAAQVQARQDAMLAAMDYAERRRRAYPSLQDQLDMIYHDQKEGTTTWLQAIEAVKAAHQKP